MEAESNRLVRLFNGIDCQRGQGADEAQRPTTTLTLGSMTSELLTPVV